MMMVVDVSGIDDRFLEVSENLAKMGEETLGVVAKIQREEIFDKMHRI